MVRKDLNGTIRMGAKGELDPWVAQKEEAEKENGFKFELKSGGLHMQPKWKKRNRASG
jgi:hypothetical protein